MQHWRLPPGTRPILVVPRSIFQWQNVRCRFFSLPPWSRGHPRTDDELASCSSSDTGLKVRLVAQSADRGVSNRSCFLAAPSLRPGHALSRRDGAAVASPRSGDGGCRGSQRHGQCSLAAVQRVGPHPDAPGMSWLRRETCAEGLGRDGGEANSWRVFPPPSWEVPLVAFGAGQRLTAGALLSPMSQ